MPLDVKRVALLAATARCCVVLATVILDWAFVDYDTSNSLLMHDDCDSFEQETSRKGSWMGQSLIVWDSVFFYRIFWCGYEYEHYHAFFPGLPS